MSAKGSVRCPSGHQNPASAIPRTRAHGRSQRAQTPANTSHCKRLPCHKKSVSLTSSLRAAANSFFVSPFLAPALVVELVDTHDSESCAARRGGSTPPLGTSLRLERSGKRRLSRRRVSKTDLQPPPCSFQDYGLAGPNSTTSFHYIYVLVSNTESAAKRNNRVKPIPL